MRAYGRYCSICDEAATALSALQGENKQLRSDLRRLQTERDTLLTANQHLREEREQLTAERDAAVDELHGKCSVCSHYTPYHNDGPCASCKFEVACFVPEKATDKWEWRGIKES